jgi:hypothetical protein
MVGRFSIIILISEMTQEICSRIFIVKEVFAILGCVLVVKLPLSLNGLFTSHCCEEYLGNGYEVSEKRLGKDEREIVMEIDAFNSRVSKMNSEDWEKWGGRNC